MKKFLIIVLCAFVCGGAYAQNVSARKELVSPRFATTTAPTLNLTNKYGNIDVAVWDKSAVEAKAEITVNKPYGDRAKQVLNCIDVKMTQSGNTINITTVVDSDAIRALLGKNKEYGYDIQIHIKAPHSAYINVESKYGNVNIESTKSKINALIKYGNLTVGEIGMPSTIEIKYGNVKITKASDLNLTIKYGNATIDDMGDMTIDSGYGNFRFGTMGAFKGVVKYDNYDFKSVKSIYLQQCKYTNVTVGKLSKSLAIDELAYGNLKVGAVAPDFSRIAVAARYSDIRIGFVTPATFAADLSTRYGNIDVNELKGKARSVQSESSTTSFTFYVGDNSANKVRISNSYADIKLTRAF